MSETTWTTLVRHAADIPREVSAEGTVARLIGQADAEGVAAWVEVVEIASAREHFHRRHAELCYVLSGEGTATLDGQTQRIAPGSIVHIPPGVIHALAGPLRVLMVGVPGLPADDTYYLDEEL